MWCCLCYDLFWQDMIWFDTMYYMLFSLTCFFPCFFSCVLESTRTQLGSGLAALWDKDKKLNGYLSSALSSSQASIKTTVIKVNHHLHTINYLGSGMKDPGGLRCRGLTWSYYHDRPFSRYHFRPLGCWHVLLLPCIKKYDRKYTNVIKCDVFWTPSALYHRFLGLNLEIW